MAQRKLNLRMNWRFDMKYPNTYTTFKHALPFKAFLAGLTALGCLSSYAFGIDKLSLELDATPQFSGVDSFTLFNDSSAEAVFVKAQALKWDSDLQGQLITTPSSDLRISPPVMRVKPGDHAVFHVRYAGAPLTIEGAYRVLFTEIKIPAGNTSIKPDEIDNSIKQGFTVGVAMSVPVYVADRSKSSQTLEQVSIQASKVDDGVLLKIKNQGDRHVTLSKYRFNGTEQKKPLGVVLAKHDRELKVDAPSPVVKLEVQITEGKESKWIKVPFI